MNTVNQMVSDLNHRMNDRPLESVVENKKSVVANKKSVVDKKFPWSVLLLVFLSVSVGVMSSINFLDVFGNGENSNSSLKRINVVKNSMPDNMNLIEPNIERQVKVNLNAENRQKTIPQNSNAAVKRVEMEKIADKRNPKIVIEDASKRPKKSTNIEPAIPIKMKPSEEKSPNKQAVIPPKKKSNENKKEITKNRLTFNKTNIPLSSAELAETIYSRGSILLEQGEFSRAEALFIKTLSEYPPHSKATEALFSIYSTQQSWIKAEKILKQGIEADGKNISLSMWLAKLYLQQEKNGPALNILKQNVIYAKGNGEYFSLMAVIYQNTQQYDLALTSYQKALEINNSSSKWWFGMAVVLELQNNFVDAQVAYIQALNSSKLPDDLISYAEQRLEYVISRTE